MGHDAMYWLKWTAGNDVRERASGVGRRGWNVACAGVLCVALEHILLPPLPLLHSDLVLGRQWLPPSRHSVDLLCCVCANVDGVPLQKSCQDWQRLLPLLCHSDGCKSSLQLFCVQ